jgi:protein subunit release factor B
MRKELLFSITKKDFTIQTFKSGGPGGQHQNKTDSGVRIIHNESGARGESRTHKSQLSNKKEALKRLIDSTQFKLWMNRKVHETIEGKTIEDKVTELMSPENLKIEVRGKDGWTEFKGQECR